MNRLHKTLNYSCLAFCVIGLFASVQLIMLKPWTFENLDSELAAYFDGPTGSVETPLAGVTEIEIFPAGETPEPELLELAQLATEKIEPVVHRPEKLKPRSISIASAADLVVKKRAPEIIPAPNSAAPKTLPMPHFRTTHTNTQPNHKPEKTQETHTKSSSRISLASMLEVDLESPEN